MGGDAFTFAFNCVPNAECSSLSPPPPQHTRHPRTQAYRSACKKLSSKTPRIPFLPIIMKDLRFIADGNEKKVDGLLNFDR